MANHMTEVAKLLGVEIGEYFEIYKRDGFYFLSYSGLYHNESGFTAEYALSKLLSGEYHINRKPWRPNKGEEYWTIRRDGTLFNCKWNDDMIDAHCYELGNYYRTKE